MNSAPDEAQALAIALEAGAVTVSEVVAWADTQIAVVSDPESTLIELALAKRAPEALGFLHELAAGADPKAVAQLALGHLYRALERDSIAPERVAQSLEQMAMNGYVPDDVAGDEMASFDDRLSVRYEDPEKVLYWMKAFLRDHAT
jgi:hypothetical protein